MNGGTNWITHFKSIVQVINMRKHAFAGRNTQQGPLINVSSVWNTRETGDKNCEMLW